MAAIPFHPLAEVFPLIEGAEFEALCADIEANGLQSPVLIWRGAIIDGRNRYRAMHEIGAVSPETGEGAAALVAAGLARDVSDMPAERLARYVLSLNLHRRHLDTTQRAMIAARLATRDVGRPEAGDNSANLRDIGLTRGEAAELLKVSPRSIDSAKALLRDAPEAIVAEAARGAVSLNEAKTGLDAARAEVAREGVPTSEQAILAAYERIRAEKAERLAEKKARRAQREADLGAHIHAANAALAEIRAGGKRYGVILADAEWRFEPYSRETGMDRAADNHYPTSPTAEIAARPVADLAARDCVLLLWATVPMLPDALQVMDAWGFTYRSHLIWHKDRPGTGYWVICQHEILLIGTRGDVPCPAPGEQPRSVIAAPCGAHSEKPGFAHELAERLWPNLPKIEMNARRARAGWDLWGAEAPEDAPVEAELTGAACRARREALGLSVPDLARAGMMAASTIRHFEAGSGSHSAAWRAMLAGVLARLETEARHEPA